MADDLKQRVCERIDALTPALVELSHDIHAHPELAFEERHAANVVAQLLRAHGVDVQAPVYGLETSFEASFGGSGPTVALLAEYDALPGIGHACGHNLIATSAVGAALGLFALEADLGGRARLLGTPAEERGGGKERMARAGAFEGVDAALMVHPAAMNLRDMPSLCVSEVDARYHGRSAHAALAPEQGVNALDGLVLAYQAIASLRQHIHSTERVHGIITEGGQAPNIVPEYAAGRFFVRAADQPALKRLKSRVQACLKAGAEATGSRLETRWADIDYLQVRSNEPLARAFQTNAERLGRRFVSASELPVTWRASTDMGNVSHRVPSIHPMLASAPDGCVLHHPDFAEHARSERGDRMAIDGAKALAMTAIDFLSDASLREAVREAFGR